METSDTVGSRTSDPCPSAGRGHATDASTQSTDVEAPRSPLRAATSTRTATPGRPERNRAARSFRQLRRFHYVSNSNRVFGTHSIRDKPIAPASPWQNGIAERLIGSIRRECLDHVIVLGEAHLRRTLKSYAAYYNRVRTHRSLHKDAPASRPVQRSGVISSRAILGGLHHHYARA